MEKKIELFAICGRSGSGKDTILKGVMQDMCGDLFHRIINCTTRPIREGETPDQDYHFMTDIDFRLLDNDDRFIETTTFNNWHYGTLIDDLDKDKINIGVFNPKSIYQLKQLQNIDLTVFYAMITDKMCLTRLMDREPNPDYKEICRRFLADKEDFEYFENSHIIDWKFFNHTRADLNQAVRNIIQLGLDKSNKIY